MSEPRKRRRPQPMTDNDRGFYTGAALAVAWLVRNCDQPSMAAELARELGLTPYRLQRLGLTEFDTRPVRQAFRERHYRHNGLVTSRTPAPPAAAQPIEE